MDPGEGYDLMKAMRHKLLTKAAVFVIVFAASGVFLGQRAAAEMTSLSVNGTSGLLMTPTADIVSDGILVAGASFVDKKWAVGRRGLNDNLSYFVTLGYLPRIELSVRLTVFSGSTFVLPGRSVVDRVLSVKALLVREGELWPAVAVGGEDIVGTKRFHTLFGVLSKDLNLGVLGSFKIHAGAGTDWIDAPNHPLDGVFGGATKRFWKRAEVLFEYDTDKVNAGFGFEPLSFARILLSAVNLESFAGALHVQYAL
jgi:hypothetical protein